MSHESESPHIDSTVSDTNELNNTQEISHTPGIGSRLLSVLRIQRHSNTTPDTSHTPSPEIAQQPLVPQLPLGRKRMSTTLRSSLQTEPIVLDNQKYQEYDISKEGFTTMSERLQPEIPENDAAVAPTGQHELPIKQQRLMSRRNFLKLAGAGIAATAVGAACLPEDFFADTRSKSPTRGTPNPDNQLNDLNTTPTSGIDLTPEIDPSPSPYIELTPTETIEPTSTPTSKPTNTPTPELTSTPEPTPTQEPTATPEVTATPEPTATPEFLSNYRGEMAFEMNHEVSSPEVFFEALLPNPAYRDQEGRNSEEVTKRAILKAFARADYVARNGRTKAETLHELDPDEFEERLTRENIEIPVYGHPIEEWNRNAKAELFTIRPEFGVNYAFVADDRMLEGYDKDHNFQGNFVEYAFIQRRNIIGSNGELTVAILVPNNFTSEQSRRSYSTEGAYTYSSFVFGGLELISHAVLAKSGDVGNILKSWDPDICQKTMVEDPDRGEPDSTHRFEWDGKIWTPLHVTKNKD